MTLKVMPTERVWGEEEDGRWCVQHARAHTHRENITCPFKIQPQPGEATNYIHEQYTKSKNETDLRSYNLLLESWDFFQTDLTM
jgi:hypothetical protein